METLSSLNMVKYWKGQYIISITNNKIIEEHFRKKEMKKSVSEGKTVKFNPYRLNYLGNKVKAS